MAKPDLKTLYRDATRALPQDADSRVTTDETLALARGESLGARQQSAVAGLAVSSEQAIAARIAMATQAWSEDLASDLADLRRPRLGERIAAWFKAATLPPVFAACAISLLAVAAWRAGEPAVGPITAPQSEVAVDDTLFGADFDGVLAHQSDADTVFGGGFDS
jgi:hypothetical protein